MVYSESEIVHALEAGNEICLNMLFDNYYRALCVYAFRFVSDADDVEDIVQEVFIAVWERDAQYPTYNAFRSFLYNSVKNAGLNHLKHNNEEEKYHS